MATLQKKQVQRRKLLKNLALLGGSLTLPSSLIANTKKSSFRIAHITDTHVQPVIGAAKGFERCLHHIQSLPIKPDFIINGGDSIMGMHGATENSIGRQWDLFGKVLKSENNLPIYHAVGNHDLYRKVDHSNGFESAKKDAMEKLGLNESYYSVTHQNWKIIVLDSIQANGKGYQGKIDEKQWDWLKNQLKQSVISQQFVMIVTHIPILSACVFFDGKNFKNGEWRIPETWMHADAEELIELFEQFPNVKLAISGHIHLNDHVEYNNVSYFCNGAVSGNWWMGKYKNTPPGYAVIDLHSDGSFENNYIKYS